MEDPPITLPGQPIFGGEMAENTEKMTKMMVRVMTIIKIAPKFIGRILAKKMMPISPPDVIEPWLDSKKRVSKDVMAAMSEPEKLIGEFDFDKLAAELGWAPEESFDSGIRKTIAWYVENKNWVERVKSGEYMAWIKQHYNR